MDQLSLAYGFEQSTKRTRKQVFLEETLAVVPGADLVTRIVPFAPAGTTGRPPYPVLLLLVHFLQQWFALSDDEAEDALHDFQAYQALAGIHPGKTGIPDATTILRFRHTLERHDLATALLGARGLMVRQGTLVDAKLVKAPKTTRDQTSMRPPSGTRPGKGTSGSSS